MMSKLTTKIENTSTRISETGALTKNNTTRALFRQVPIRANTRNEPTTQLYMIFSAGKGDVLELQPEIRRRPDNWLLWHVDQLSNDVERKSSVSCHHNSGK